MDQFLPGDTVDLSVLLEFSIDAQQQDLDWLKINYRLLKSL